MLEPAVDGFDGDVAGAGPVEEPEHVDGALCEGVAEPADLDECGGDSCRALLYG